MDMDTTAAAGALPVDNREGSPRAASSPAAAGRKRRAVARGVQGAVAKASMLANFLPTGTMLAFEVLLPTASGGDGSCSGARAAALRALLALCAAACFLLHLSDSFRAADGRVYYGVVTPAGLSLLRTGLGVEAPREDRFRLAVVDVAHAAMSVLVFAAAALADGRVSGCLLRGHRKEMGEVMESFPLMVGAVGSALFLVFPNARHGIGCLAA
ncbi:hypothetical protein ACP4OV_017465 [Aristida adscensionis]